MADASPTGTVKPAAAQSPGGSARAANRWWLPAAVVLVAWACLRLPQATLSTMLDPSWTGVLIYAREKGMQFGHDIVFTYGPLGFLAIECFSPYAVASRIVFEIALGGGIAAGLCLLAWRMPMRWRLGALGYFIFVSAPLHWGGDALFIDLGLFAWGLLCFLESGRRLTLCAGALVILAAVGALIKITFLMTGAFTAGLVACDLAARGRRALAANVVAGFVLAFLAGWMLLGQNVSGLDNYLSASFAVSSGYNEAMGASEINVMWVLMVTLAALAAMTIRAAGFSTEDAQPTWLRRGRLWIWMAGMLFVEWKYACVRTDSDHVVVMLGVVPLAAICLEALPVANRAREHWSRTASLLSVIAALAVLHSYMGGTVLLKFARRTCKNLSENLGIIVRPGHYARTKTAELRAEQARSQLPRVRATVGRATADVFGDKQGLALLNELNYQPRPVFQSYSVYSRRMMELNEQFYLSRNAPEYALFNLQALDGRFPPLEDAYVLRDLLRNYEMVASEADYLLLRRKGTAKPRLTLLKEGTVSAGEKIDLSKQGEESIWLEIELRPTLAGRVRKFLYKLPPTHLVVWSETEPGAPVRYAAPAIMLAAGFLASPLMVNNEDVKNFYSGAKVRRASALAVESETGGLSAWETEIHYRIYRIEK